MGADTTGLSPVLMPLAMERRQSQAIPYVTVCIPTYRRPALLDRLLRRLEHLKTDDKFRYSVLVVDNDLAETARSVVSARQSVSSSSIEYTVEPEQNLALVRNRALLNAEGDFIAFIDDDEFPEDDWILRLLEACVVHRAAGVLGPVVPHFETDPPNWVIMGRILDRPRYRTGHVLTWSQTRTGNVLLRRNLFCARSNLFDPAFGRHGEDRDFFRRLIGTGHTFVWCDEAVVHETQPASRLTRGYLLRRSLVRGSVAYAHERRKSAVIKSMAALGLYAIGLPFLQLRGHHWFMTYLIKWFDHLGRVLAALGIPMERYIRLS